jgi:hypothetical protein
MASTKTFFSKSGPLARLMKKSRQFKWRDWVAWCHRGKALMQLGSHSSAYGVTAS